MGSHYVIVEIEKRGSVWMSYLDTYREGRLSAPQCNELRRLVDTTRGYSYSSSDGLSIDDISSDEDSSLISAELTKPGWHSGDEDPKAEKLWRLIVRLLHDASIADIAS